MSDEASGLLFKRRSTAAAAPGERGAATCLSPLAAARGGGGTVFNDGPSTPHSRSRSPITTGSFAKEHHAAVASSVNAPMYRGKAASRPHSSADRGCSSSNYSGGGASPIPDSFQGSSLRTLKPTWRHRQHFKCRACVALLLFLLLLWCVVHSGGMDRKGGPSLPSSPANAVEHPAADLAEVEDTLLDIEAMGPQEELTGDLTNWSVLIQHEDAMSRMPLTAEQRTCLITMDDAQDCGVGRVHMSRGLLPSWTLAFVQPLCTDCMFRRSYARTVDGVKLFPKHGVVATSAAPLGRVGPMLYAMSSVTNDINVQEELPRWSWLAHVYPNFPTVTSGATENTDEVHEAPRPYLAVMGVPSTDQPARVALRTAQRATWMRYQEVARTENNFEGALLPLYLFAATEMTSESPATTAEVKEGDDVAAGPLEADPEANEMDNEDAAAQTTQPTTTTTTSTTSTPAPPPEVSMCGRTDVLLPTVREFQRASSLFARLPGAGAQEQGKGPDRDMSDDSFVQRRVVLRSDYPSADVLESPCRGVVEAHVNAAAVPHLPLTRLSRSIGLNITPAFVSAAQYICCASAALWKEALTHRNVVWIDMLTDRRPTTNKKLGDTTKWGLPVEVGMSQKLILWLSYAYHAFPNVPYIIKGDDDMYLKVPQFLSDARMLRRGRRNGRLPPPPLLSSAVADGKAVNTYVDPDEPFPMDKTKCMYWGSTRRMRNFYFNAGMLFVLQRRLVQVVLERPQEGSGEKDLLELAARNYSKSLFRLYKSLSFDKEDVLIGATLHRRHARAKELCYKHQVWYGFEERVRFHDLRKGRAQPITVNTVVAHRCRPADLYFMQYFFQNELAFARADVAPGESREDLAREAAAAWVAETRKTLPDDVTNWNSLPEVVWYHNVHTGPSFWIAENDHVPVYNVSYTFWNSSQLTVEVGYKGRSHAMSKP
jgi:phosphoglycan beta-1,3-galactosyltransferase